MRNIGEILYGKLNQVASTYPLVAENTTRFPFIIYRTTAVRPQDTKDGIYEWIYNVQVNIVDDHYDKVLELCDQAIDKVLELQDEMDINIVEVSEDFVDDAYVRELHIEVKI